MSNNSQFNVGDMKAALAKVVPTLPHKLGVLTVEYSMEAFRTESWDGKKWKPRQSKVKGAQKAILIHDGILKRSVRITKESPDETRVGTDIIYAKIHNEGGQIVQPPRTHVLHFDKKNKFAKSTTKKQKESANYAQKVNMQARTINMPQRQFLGVTKELEKQIIKSIETDILKSLNNI